MIDMIVAVSIIPDDRSICGIFASSHGDVDDSGMAWETTGGEDSDDAGAAMGSGMKSNICVELVLVLALALPLALDALLDVEGEVDVVDAVDAVDAIVTVVAGVGADSISLVATVAAVDAAMAVLVVVVVDVDLDADVVVVAGEDVSSTTAALLWLLLPSTDSAGLSASIRVSIW